MEEINKEVNKNTSEQTSYNEYFSKIYDKALDILPYDEMANFLENIFKANNLQPKSILDLGCGSGTLAIIMAKRGFNMTGLDLSVDMLSVAHQKTYDENLKINYIHQSMSELNLIENYDIIYSFGDAINYIIDENELLSTFKGIYKYVKDGGYFIFDVNTIAKFKNYGNNTFSESEDDFFYIWENEFDEEENLNYYYVEMFVKKESAKTYEELYTRSFETHIERGYELDYLQNMLYKVGFKNIKVYTDLNFNVGNKSEDRFYFICEK